MKTQNSRVDLCEKLMQDIQNLLEENDITFQEALFVVDNLAQSYREKGKHILNRARIKEVHEAKDLAWTSIQ